MNIKKIEEVINLVKSNGVKRFKFKDNKSELELDFTEGVQSQGSVSTPTQASQSTYSNEETLPQSQNESSNESAQEIKSPMVGTFFLQDSKELTEPQIKVGDQIKSGDVIGYIEAMKVMNEVTSDVDGEVAEIVVDHGTNVEYDQVLVKVK
ncbi:acetyl-CoA carboxylase biotin carboxyl carrier protein subunit [Staphylococcus sp. NRL 16/872]|uniref:acetyl-CoA carboxylase biotin carboxyl carrier protein n=1 Tax=Staphylococcus sp. NRL 16/872 TaxID=2930131 RepID=UPI001FB3D519|nr:MULTISPECIES: biotin/lipoyl-containing protein [unclassified Staphylococcus]MCJ1656221.1 acetyl-CoA carboxylase biotin carboxyl carrier protein subunit [Staphylococcus sp. NRL 21/187]MCJ1661988.1 acetyl-CoA carboxylase biotin carboxyl carrier protein subunit [Staphylococcus sp. NRL 18/288]MCJ1668043.1 acetyl-CoA carboxylase biotin carboxyl carrier protein subunit [Staphylococcus sp. NRL 19/737]WEN68246.1 acetyl-CoA carboxylase biotin carboxyl carrier protein subunit [Staphylococcus sp. NRL 1